jgi:hypothetical protein
VIGDLRFARLRLTVVSYLTAFLMLAVLTAAEPFWTRPYEQWTREEAQDLLQDSPWSSTIRIESQRPARPGAEGEDQGAPETVCTVRLFSALPVRQAYVRLFRLLNGSDNLSVEQREDLDRRLLPALRPLENEIVISLDLDSSDPETSHELKQQLKTGNLNQFRQSARLISKRLGPVQLVDYVPPSPDGSGAKFVFPRSIERTPVVLPTDSTLEFEFWIPGTGQKVLQIWRMSQLVLNGEPAI